MCVWQLRDFTITRLKSFVRKENKFLLDFCPILHGFDSACFIPLSSLHTGFCSGVFSSFFSVVQFRLLLSKTPQWAPESGDEPCTTGIHQTLPSSFVAIALWQITRWNQSWTGPVKSSWQMALWFPPLSSALFWHLSYTCSSMYPQIAAVSFRTRLANGVPTVVRSFSFSFSESFSWWEIVSSFLLIKLWWITVSSGESKCLESVREFPHREKLVLIEFPRYRDDFVASD